MERNEVRSAISNEVRPARHLHSAFRVLIFFCLFLIATDVSAQSGWVKQHTGTLAWLHSLFFFDRNHGWVVGSKGTVLVTKNGGETWQAMTRPTEDILRDIYFADELNGWLVCERNIYDLKTREEPRAYLMNTSDGGESWQRVEISGLDVDARLSRALFNGRGQGWAFGEGGIVYKTHDSGTSWVRVRVPTRNLLLGGTFVDDDRGWVVGAGATILQTSDGGESWHLARLTDANGIRFNATSFVNNRLGWAVGSGGRVYQTTNGGRTWQSQISGVTADLLDVKFLDGNEGWAVGHEGTVIHTSDGGRQWSLERTGTTHPLERVFFVDHNRGWAVGFGGTIIAYERVKGPTLQN